MTGATSGDEVAGLREEVARLRAEAAPTWRPTTRTGRWRPPVVAVLVLVGALLAPLAVVATWVDDLVNDTDTYVETVTPLAGNPRVQAAIADRVTATLFEQLDIEAVTRDAVDALSARGLPGPAVFALDSLAGPLADALRGFVSERVDDLVRSEQFREAWIDANRAAHRELVALLSGRNGDALQVNGNAVTINLASIISILKDRLAESGFALVDRIPEVQAEFTLLASADLVRLQSGFRLLDAVSTLLPILVLACFAGAVAVARSRRRAVLLSAIGLASGMLLLGIALNTFRIAYLDALPDHVSTAAAAAVYDELAYFIRLALRGVLDLALVVAAVAWVAGPGAAPAALRRGVRRAFDATRGSSDRPGNRVGRVGTVAWTYRGPVRAVVLGAAMVLYVTAAHPSGAWTLTLAGFTAAVLLLVEILARPTAPV